MATRSKSKHSSSKAARRSSTANCALIIAAVLAFLLAASVGVLIWKMLGLESEFNRVSEFCDKETVVWKLYPGYFRSKDLQERAMRLREVNLNVTRTNQPRSCNFKCSTTPAPVNLFQPLPGRARTTPGPGQPRIPGRFQPRRDPVKPQQRGGPFSDFVFHSCCTSGRRYVTPVKVRSLMNVEVEIVQEENYKQYFMEESCDQDLSCTGCTCSQPEPFIYQAVVFRDKFADDPEDKYEIESIKLPGSCKCLNK